MKKFSIFILLVMAAPIARADIKTQTIEYKQGDVVLEGYLAYDDALVGKQPGVLVVHEWKGLNEYAKGRTRQLAELGYVAFAADIYGKGIRPQTADEAGKEAGKYKGDRMLLRARALAAVDQLKSQANVDPSKLAAIGYCFGGTTVLELARANADLKGIVSFHGGLSAGNAPTETPKAKILVLHGADDPFVPPAEVDAFKAEMDKVGADYQFVSYPDAVHGFTNPDNQGEIKGALYNISADAQSWQAMQKFFNGLFNPEARVLSTKETVTVTTEKTTVTSPSYVEAVSSGIHAGEDIGKKDDR